MQPRWDPSENDQHVSEKRRVHSRGLISFAYQPPTRDDLRMLEDTEAYRRFGAKAVLEEDQGGESGIIYRSDSATAKVDLAGPGGGGGHPVHPPGGHQPPGTA